MQLITAAEAGTVGGSLSLWSWLYSQGSGSSMLMREVLAGNVDYAGLAASQGHSYNLVGA